jgi:glycerate-2-kinase
MNDTPVQKIKNGDTLASTPLRRDALRILEAGLQAIDTGRVIRESIMFRDDALCIRDEVCSLTLTNRVFFIGIGKCASEAAVAIEALLGDRLEGGVVLDVAIADTCKTQRIECFTGTHPYPTDQNVEITRRIVDRLQRLTERDLVIVFVSGGGSTLLCLPDEKASCIDERLLLGALIRAGATIQEINTVRKHISLARGGHLARYAYPAQVISLIVSDVPGDDIAFVASGPTVKDETLAIDALNILNKYRVSLGDRPIELLETPKDDRYFKNVWNILLVSNERALNAMADEAKRLGYVPHIKTRALSGEASSVASIILADLHAAPTKSALLYGGETTVVVRGNGSGGRNQELSLAALTNIKAGELIVSLASDGRDNSDAAGGIADAETQQHASREGITNDTYLATNDAHTFFARTGDSISTGHTGSNVSDLILALKL